MKYKDLGEVASELVTIKENLLFEELEGLVRGEESTYHALLALSDLDKCIINLRLAQYYKEKKDYE